MLKKMNFISTVADTLNFVIHHLFIAAEKLFQWNFRLVSFIITFLEYLEGTLVLNVLSILNILKSYYRDFVIFLYEVISVIQFLVNVASDFIYKIYLKVAFVAFTIQELLDVIHQNVLAFLSVIQVCVLQIYEISAYLIELIFTSTLLLLQLGPNLLILLCEFIITSLCHITTLAKHSAITLVENLCNVFYRSGEAIISIPMKAYLGAVLCLALYYHRHSVYTFFKEYLAHLLFTVLQLGILISNLVRYVFSIFVSVLRKIKHFFFPERGDTFYDASSSDLNLERDDEPLQKNFIQKYSQGVKDLCCRILFLNNDVHVEEQIKQLQNELTAEREKHMCVICFDSPRSIIFYPCRHMCVCDDCGANLITNRHTCPLCRSRVSRFYHVYT